MAESQTQSPGVAPPIGGLDGRRTQIEFIREAVELCDDLLATLRKCEREDPAGVGDALMDFTTALDLLEIRSGIFILEKDLKSPQKIQVGDTQIKVPGLVRKLQDWIARRNLGDEYELAICVEGDEVPAETDVLLAYWGEAVYRAYKAALFKHGLYDEKR